MRKAVGGISSGEATLFCGTSNVEQYSYIDFKISTLRLVQISWNEMDNATCNFSIFIYT